MLRFIQNLIDRYDVWVSYRRLRTTLRRNDLKTIADVKRELGLDSIGGGK